MAPFVPEELDVFTIPHSRMKELVSDYVEQLEKTNFSDYVDMQRLLSSLSEAFQEFKKHEQIENSFIMKRLKNKLKELSIRNTAVCNCHKDSHLTEILHLVQDGYTKKTVQDRVNYGLQLRKKLEDFTEDFLPHMQQEEEVFQPLLLQYFTYKELCELRRTVIQLHLQEKDDSNDPWQFLKHLKAGCKEEESDEDEKDDYCEYLSSEKEKREIEKDNTAEKDFIRSLEKGEKLYLKSAETVPPDKTILDLPNEIMLKVMTYLSPRDLGRCTEVCRDWSVLAKDPSAWRELHPVKWAKGEWDYEMSNPIEETEDEDEDQSGDDDGEQYILIDEDADVDESADCDEENAVLREIKHEAKLLTGLVKNLLPAVGQGVKVLNLAHSRALTSGLLRRMLKCCPNVEYLDLTQTKISDMGLKGLGKNYCGSQLKKLILNGCVNVGDASLIRLAAALSQPIICCDKESRKKPKAPDPEEKESEPDVETKTKVETPVQAPSYTDQDIESLPQKLMSKEKPLSRDKSQTELHEKSSLVQMIEDFCVDYQTNWEIRNKISDFFMEKENSKWENFVTASCRNGEQNFQRGRMKGGGEHGKAGGGFDDPCCKVANGACCRCQNDDVLPSPEDKGPRGGDDDDDMMLRPPPQPVHGDGAPNVVIARDKVPGGNETTTAAKFKQSDCSEASVMGCCHEGCKVDRSSDSTQLAIEDCAAVAVPPEVDDNEPEYLDEFAEDLDTGPPVRRQLQYLGLSGCYQITDFGLRALADCGAFAELYGLDLSGCSGLTGPGIEALVNMCPALDPEHLYYCDNIVDGPLMESASGCRNQSCGARYCCRMMVAQ